MMKSKNYTHNKQNTSSKNTSDQNNQELPAFALDIIAF